jgi:hypothetical protein
MAAQMLILVWEKGFEGTVTHITQNYDTTREQVTTDLRLLLFQNTKKSSFCLAKLKIS